MKGKNRYALLEEEYDLDISEIEIEEIENDEISAAEAGFMSGYEKDYEDNY